MTKQEIFEELTNLNDPQLNEVVVMMNLDTSLMRANDAVVERAYAIWQLLQQQDGWLANIESVLNKVKGSTRGYFHERLKYIQDFLVEPPWSPERSEAAGGTIKELREKLKKVGKVEAPQLVRVRGTLFPAALLNVGWWERKRRDEKFRISWKNTLQQWLFEGFDLWAPSWDISWDLEGSPQTEKPYRMAQLTDGDEADSIAVVVPAEHARKIRDEFLSGWGGVEAEVTGVLGHRYQFQKQLPPDATGQPSDYCIALSDGEKKHRIEPLVLKTELYSGYLWKCLAPNEWMNGDRPIGIDQVYFVWEHTNFAARDARDYNLDALLHKESLIRKAHPGSELVLLQKSHPIVPGKSLWQGNEIYELLLGQKVKVPGGQR